MRILDELSIDDLDGGADEQRGYVSLLHGAPPEVCVFQERAEEQRFMLETLRLLLRDRLAHDICVVARTRRILEELVEPVLEKARLPHVRLEGGSDREAGPGIRVATMHRVKGLEFPCVVVCGLTQGVMPWRPQGWEGLDSEARAAHDMMERCLLYVASTRARDRLYLTAGGTPGEFLRFWNRETRLL
ncbi:MAG: hypothetical protein HY303_05695 [Candidatus Wallbacteria bacterium]|nr:hypothetical protein [Candidatus Wallbacteria bacterium]